MIDPIPDQITGIEYLLRGIEKLQRENTGLRIALENQERATLEYQKRLHAVQQWIKKARATK